MRIHLRDWIEERNERTTVSDQHPVLTCSQSGILLQSAYFKKQIASQDNAGYKIVHRGDFTYRAMSDTGRFYIHQMDCAEIGIVSPAYPVFFLKKDAPIVPEYLLLFFESKLFHELVSSKSKGSTRLSLRLSKIEELVVDFPDVDEQNKRISLMNSLLAQIGEIDRRAASYDESIKSLFIEMFGLPTDNKHGFEIASIGDVVCDVHYGTSKKASDDGEYTYLRMNNITYDGELDLTDTKKISMSEKELAGCMVRKGDVLFNRTNSRDLVGKTCAFTLDEPMVIAGYIIRLRMNGRVLPEYLSTFLNLKCSKKMLFDMAKGAVGQANINAQEIQSVRLLVPPIEAQIPFQKLVEMKQKLRFNAAKQKRLFEEYRSSFLQDFFEGGSKHE